MLSNSKGCEIFCKILPNKMYFWLFLVIFQLWLNLLRMLYSLCNLILGQTITVNKLFKQTILITGCIIIELGQFLEQFLYTAPVMGQVTANDNSLLSYKETYNNIKYQITLPKNLSCNFDDFISCICWHQQGKHLTFKSIRKVLQKF